MSTPQIDFNTASQLFDTQVTIRYQNHQYLMGTIEERHGTTGDAMNVPVSSQIEMSQTSFAPTNIPVTPVIDTNVIITPYDYKVKTVIGGGYKTLFAYDKIVDHAKQHALAIARMLDYIKIQAIFTSPLFSEIYTVPVDIGPTTGLSQAKVTNALAELEDQGVDVYDETCKLWMPAPLKNSLFSDQNVTNIFFNDVRPLTNNRIQEYLGVDFRTLGSAGINSIPFTTSGDVNTYLVPLVHKEAMVQTFNRDPQTTITWVQQEDRYELVSTMTSGCNIIQTRGIALLTCANPYVANS